MNLKAKSLAIVLVLVLLLVASPGFLKRAIFLAVIFKDAFSGAAPVIVYEGKLDRVWENGFEVTIEVECNRLVDRMISVRFDPYVKPGQIPEGSIHGKSTIAVSQDDYSFTGEFLLDRYGMQLVGGLQDGRWLARGKYIGEYPAIGGMFCSDQVVHVRVDDLNFDPREHEITVRVNRYFLR